jgi:uncharacterized membrane protein
VIHSFLIGLAGGARSMTPLAAVALAAHHRRLPEDNGAPRIVSHPLVVAGAVALALGELLGDKMRSAPDRIVLAGMTARIVNGAVTGASLARRDDRLLGAALGAAGACLSAYVTFDARMRAMELAGQTSTGLVEDAITLGATALVMHDAVQARRAQV